MRCICGAGQADEDFIPIIVTPRLGKPQAEIALVLPTFSYLAYANEQMAQRRARWPVCSTTTLAAPGRLHRRQRSAGLYDRHTDGSSVCYSSWLRPLVNMRPKYTQAVAGRRPRVATSVPCRLAPRGLAGARWATEFDVLTDVELHRDGSGTTQGIPRWR